jgi:hypothetical protein
MPKPPSPRRAGRLDTAGPSGGSSAAQIDIPLAYAAQLYNLPLHIKLLEQKLDGVAAGADTL